MWWIVRGSFWTSLSYPLGDIKLRLNMPKRSSGLLNWFLRYRHGNCSLNLEFRVMEEWKQKFNKKLLIFIPIFQHLRAISMKMSDIMGNIQKPSFENREQSLTLKGDIKSNCLPTLKRIWDLTDYFKLPLMYETVE